MFYYSYEWNNNRDLIFWNLIINTTFKGFGLSYSLACVPISAFVTIWSDGWFDVTLVNVLGQLDFGHLGHYEEPEN